ncbi:G-protein-signaling modulator 3 isoform X2 [Sciurus carolinensis]|uniref:G-protein-signaling modulator 3 isoform X2 n=1 Tax=Sciurus carolinensis TaxID=30640 RepID=UPI001FB39780|nr:G-protein-signaling modulator 3 isoform X2 [Sciurus carolinensis]
MGGAMGGLTRNPASCSVPSHPSPSSPPPLPAPTPLRNSRFRPSSRIPATPPPSVSPRKGMEAERPQEEDGEQGSPEDELGWPPLNSTIRPWRSAPPSPPPGTRHTVAEAQSRRLEEQRATFRAPQNPSSLTPAPPRPLEDREQLYSTILSHQCQRMEAQRSEPPLPPGGQELLELLLRVQGGGRMEEQRSRPPTHTC